MKRLTENVPFDPWFSCEELDGQVAELFKWEEGQAIAQAPAFVTIHGTAAVVLPRFCPPNGTTAQTLATVTTLVTALRERNRRSAQRAQLKLVTSDGSSADELGRLESAMALWADYREHGGLYFTQERISCREQGRIRWSKTLRSPMVMSGLAPVYPYPIRSQVGVVPRHAMTTLHQQTCLQAGGVLGWMAPAPHVVSSSDALRILENHKHALFQDRHRRIWGQLKRFHTAAGRAPQDDEFRSSGCIAPSFPHIWERMVQVTLGPQAEFDLPKGTYHLGAGKTAPGVRLLPDLVISEDGMTLIVDAKDYATGSWPPSESINKQIMYRLFLTTDHGGPIPPERAHNIFVRPMALPGPAFTKYLGAHEINRDPKGLGRIHCVGLDFESAASAYARGKPLPRAREELVSHLL